MSLTEKEFEIVNVIADGFRHGQRGLSFHVGLSLGMTNLLLRRLVTKGFLRAKQLDRKKVEYLITPRGIVEKTKKSYLYTLKTLQSFGLIRKNLIEGLQSRIGPEIDEIVLLGQGDLADFSEMVLRNHFGKQVKVYRQEKTPNTFGPHKLVIDANPEPNENGGTPKLNLIHVIQSPTIKRTKENEKTLRH